MIRESVQYINTLVTTLNVFQQKHEIVEVVTKEDESFPAEFCTTEYNPINFDFDKSTSYHRSAGQVQREIDEDSSTGCEENILQRYPMRFVGVFPRNIYNTSDKYIDEKIANNIVNVIEKPNVKSLSISLKLDSLAIQVTGFSTDKNAIWDEEFTNIELKIPSDWGMIAVDYQVEAVGQPSCFDLVGCEGADIDWLAQLRTDICEVVNVSNSDNSYNVNTASDLELPDITVSNSDESYSVTSPSVKDIEIPDIDIANSDNSYTDTEPGAKDLSLPDVNHTDSDGSVTAYPGMKPFVCTPCGDAGAIIAAATCAQLNTNLTTAQRKVIYRVPTIYTGQGTVSYQVGDDGHYHHGRGVNFYTLSCNNEFGNTNRFTNSVGGSVTNGSDGSLANYAIDHLTGYGWYLSPVTGVTWANAITAAEAFTTHFTDWFIPNIHEFYTIVEKWSLFLQHTMFNITGGFWWSSTTFGPSPTLAYVIPLASGSSTSNGVIQTRGKTLTSNYILARIHYA